MITEQQMNECKSAGKERGFIIDDKDIAYVTMCKTFENKQMVYTLLFKKGKQLPPPEYDKSEKITYLHNYISDLIKRNRKGGQSSTDVKSISEAISFEENREAMEKLLAEIKQAKQDGTIELDKALKLETDIRTKLNDKFNIKEQSVEQRIIVQPKFNHVCEYTQRECWLQTREYAKEHWHLIDDPNYYNNKKQ